VIVQLRRYGLVLRLAIFVLPIISFVIAGLTCIHALGISPPIFSANYFYLTLFTTMVWSIVAEREEVTSIAKVSAEYTGLYACLSACGITCIVDLIALFLVHGFDFSRSYFLISAFLLLVLSVAVRTVFRISLRQMAEHRTAVRVVILGTGRCAARAATRIARNEFVPCSVQAYIQLPNEEIRVTNAPVVQLADLETLEGLEFDDIIVAVSPDHYGVLGRCISKLEFLGKPIRIIVNTGNAMKVRDRIVQLGRLQMLDLDPSPTSSVGYFFVKRAFDLAFASLVLGIVAIPMLAIAIFIRLSSPGPILFRQLRVGKNGRLFTMYKFRTMRVAPAGESDTCWTAENDPRRTRLGAFLRSTSLDELPQFLNVLKGDMSVVGPRPERPHFVKKFRKEIAFYQTRHHLNVGITGWAQVNGLRGDTSIKRRIRYDLYYLQHWSLAFDIRIIFMTLWSGFMDKNAY
jgi:Undecaprenyl-phosphate glucose phosphotransferase